MQKIPSEIHAYVTSIQRIDSFSQHAFLTADEGIYVYIPTCASLEIYAYLKKIHFIDFYPILNHFDDSFQLFHVEGKQNEHRLFLLGDYYLKSSNMVSFDPQMIEKIYEKCIRNIRISSQFYFDVQNRIEEMLYPRKPYYYLLLKISDIHHLHRLGEFFLNEWYQRHPLEYREVLLLKKLDSYNFWGNKILNVSDSKRDYYVYELANYYQMYYEEDSILDEIDQFVEQFSMNIDDLLLFYALISYVREFEWELFEDEDSLLQYVSKTYSYLLEKYEEYQNTKEEVFKE